MTAETAPRPPDSPIITSSLLRALGGDFETVVIDGAEIDLPSNGANLWGVELTDAVDRVSNHVFIAGRIAYAVGNELKSNGIPGYENIDLGLLTQGAILHDVIKLPSRPREQLTPDQRTQIGLEPNYREISDQADDIAIQWLQKHGLAPEVYNAIRAHDFPQQIVDDPYWKILVIADSMAGQHVMTVDERLDDVKTRWIDEPKAKAAQEGKEPLLGIEENRFERARMIINEVANEIFGSLGTTDAQFIHDNSLTDDSKMPKWEKFLRNQRKKGKESFARRKDAPGPLYTTTNPHEDDIRRNMGTWRETRMIHVLESLERLDSKDA